MNLKNLNVNQQYTIVKLIGRGHFGQTYLVKNKQNQYYALKLFYKPDRDYYREVENLIQLSKTGCNPDIICYKNHFIFNGQYAILSDYIDGVNLEQFKHRLNIKNIKHIGLWLFGVLSWLHKKGYAHNDISLSNIMLDKNNQLKLIDFGLSCNIYAKIDSYQHCTAKRLVNQDYKSPELASGQYLQNVKKYSQTSDVWAAGMVLYKLLSNNHQNVPFMNKILNPNPNQRVNAQQAYQLLL
ncbi:MAG TPA: protein kinase family protein [Candidatus Saccharimonadales bacterium]|nr:protein kinase family protein [Candidatus Saccharimonadales bacterium]